MAQMIKNLPAMKKTWVRSLGGEDPLEKGMATHSSILAWRIPWTGDQRVRHNWVTNAHTHIFWLGYLFFWYWAFWTVYIFWPPVLWPPDAKAYLLEKTMILGKIEGRRKKGHQRVRWLGGITDSMDMNLSKLQEMVKDRKPGMLGVTWGPWGHKEWDTT